MSPLTNSSLVAPPRRSLGWRVRHSAWLLAPILGIGLFSCVGFIYCAVRVRTRRWTVLAALATCATVLAWIIAGSWQDAAGSLSDAAGAYVVGLWMVSIILGFVVNRDYLAWRLTTST